MFYAPARSQRHISEDDMASPYQRRFSGSCKLLCMHCEARAELDGKYFVRSAKAGKKARRRIDGVSCCGIIYVVIVKIRNAL